MKTLLTILSLILSAGTSWGQTKPVDPTIVWIIVGAGGAGVTCDWRWVKLLSSKRSCDGRRTVG